MLRWYAKEYAQRRICCCEYMGWTVATEPMLLDADKHPNCTRLFSTAEVFVKSVGKLREIASESAVYMNFPLDERINGVEISAPYISIRNYVSVELRNMNTSHYVLYFGIPDISCKQVKDYSISYIFDLHPKLAIGGSRIYGTPKFTLKKGEVHDDGEKGFNSFHMMAMGILGRKNVLDLCKSGSITHKFDMKKCVKTPPNPNVWSYPADFPKFTYWDMLLLLGNKNVEEICASIRRPFMYYYPEVDYSANADIAEMVRITKKRVDEMKGLGYPNCP